ncbi:ribokinase [Bhargavaea ullalensis]|uniref:Ribokinase n=1 Tax=Bhargavaea ullalensis TaxID=1265685 RepID=A0ABV2GA55_9BACL
MDRRVAVVGSLNMDLITRTARLPKIGETILGESIDYLPGGKGANQAVAAARLGCRVDMVGAVGADAFGDVLIAGLEEDGIETGSVRRTDVPTGIANIFSVGGDNCITVVPGANGTVTPDSLDDKAMAAIREADVVILQMEIPVETVTHVLAEAKKAGVRTILNPAPAQVLPDSLLADVDYLTPNETEFELLAGRRFSSDLELEVLMKEWEDRHGHALIVTLGERGCTFLEDGRMATIAPPKVKAVDTTGAGDCFNGALASGIAQEWPLRRSLEFAVAASSLAVTKFGAQAGMPTLEDVGVDG